MFNDENKRKEKGSEVNALYKYIEDRINSRKPLGKYGKNTANQVAGRKDGI